jgi:hypothetical protein
MEADDLMKAIADAVAALAVDAAAEEAICRAAVRADTATTNASDLAHDAHAVAVANEAAEAAFFIAKDRRACVAIRAARNAAILAAICA